MNHLVYQALETLAETQLHAKKYDFHPGYKDWNAHGAHRLQSRASDVWSLQSTTSAGKAPTGQAIPKEPQSKQTKLLIKIRDLLKQLPFWQSK